MKSSTIYSNVDYVPTLKNLSKRERRQLRKMRQSKNSLCLSEVIPKNLKQQQAFDSFYDNKNVILHGVAGTGKTFIALYLALSDVLENENGAEKITIVRSAVPTRDMGFLPGTLSAKSVSYEYPYIDICSELFNRNDAYSSLKEKGLIEFMTTSYVRGTTMSNSIVIIDEAQNLSFHELDSIMTRLGENSTLLLAGDFRQTDLQKDYEKKGLLSFINIVSSLNDFELIEFDTSDIVRSELVKNYIIGKMKHGYI